MRLLSGEIFAMNATVTQRGKTKTVLTNLSSIKMNINALMVRYLPKIDLLSIQTPKYRL